MSFTTPIIPLKVTETSISDTSELDLKAICIFSAIGFFLGDDTYWKNKKILQPATHYKFNKAGILQTAQSYFKWHYSPRNISFNDVLEEFTTLFETIITEQTYGKKVILPLSGGLDSRTQAAALHHLKANVSSYSYEFTDGYPETKIAKQMANVCNFDFKSFKIKKGYLWNVLDDLAKLNQCYSDFTSPRQMAIADQFSTMGDVFSLGHWGDVLFDSYNSKPMTHEEQVQFLSKKLVKRGGLEFASNLWDIWNLGGDFKPYFENRISMALSTIAIKDTNARLRAFKSKYWAPRWTSVNLSIFEKYKPITLPYYDNRMCEFICTIPEEFLKDRQLQIAYIKKRNPQLAKLTWQDKRPYNLYNYQNPNVIKTVAYKAINKSKRTFTKILGKPYIQRNWELQFLGEENRKQLEVVLKNAELSQLVPDKIVKRYTNAFYNKNSLAYAHALNMLLVLATFNQNKTND